MSDLREPFGAESTALEVVDGIDLRNSTAVVTGAGSGIGVETARALAAAGAAVTLAVRDVTTGNRVATDIRASTGNEAVHAVFVDLADVGSIRSFTDSWSGPLHLLVNNAGVMDLPEQRTPDGWEMHFAVNHLGHFALAQGMHAAMRSAGGARIVSLSSSGHASSGIGFDDLFFDSDPYDPGLAYGQSKTANVLFALEATRRWEDDGIAGSAVMPGGIWTNLQRHWDPAVLADMQRRYPTKTVEQGAATSVYVATRAELGVGTPGYYEDCHPAKVVAAIQGGVHGVLPHALDRAAADRLWEVSERLLARSR
ncbi:SDR family NAD(P)-dependent oxidoreductase [Curtobacterium herbarum]|uniref:SDR family NAD(P)-dependent oxidoreductase n=1 Tax=Curtobacterium herbarum TaxID=150122 RepID=A0ABP4K1V7_9MICO|nr:SDR family NAD(P)-dependent oxidoreductase [Curtobacterium herbarum]MBM7475932.1 NAD(P)-dependent dehydrogenase (short-subunit alcohol dehydrogenase family) [Curtobacterium herbarum]MCS6544499.1 SDR family NAD(P)-dependent oxidoreductase [Curtobacterium herbarum]